MGRRTRDDSLPRRACACAGGVGDLGWNRNRSFVRGDFGSGCHGGSTGNGIHTSHHD